MAMQAVRTLPILLLALAATALAGESPGAVPEAGPGSVLGEIPAELPRLAWPAGLGRLVRPASGMPAPLVVMLPDALGEDGRSEPYVESLAARGIATLALGLGEDLEQPDAPADPASSPRAVPPALAWAIEAGFAPEAIGLLGFGRGGRAVLAAETGLPSVALYPGCQVLHLPEDGPALVLQGGDDAQGCAELPSRPGLELRLLSGAGHAWDAPGAIWPSPGPVLPDPGGAGVRRSRADLQVTLGAAEAVADWFERRLRAPGGSIGR